MSRRVRSRHDGGPHRRLLSLTGGGWLTGRGLHVIRWLTRKVVSGKSRSRRRGGRRLARLALH
jgi:hypothetical protein